MTWRTGSRMSTTAVAPAATSTRSVTCRTSMMPAGMVYGVTTAATWVARRARALPIAAASGHPAPRPGAPVAFLPDPGGPDGGVGQERAPDHHEQQRQPGFRAVLRPARPDQHRQADEQGRDQRQGGQEVQLLVGVAHDQDAGRRGEHQDDGQAQQDVGDDPLRGHSHRSRNRTNTSPLPNSSRASSTGSSNSPERRNPSASSTSTISTTELMAS